MTQCKEGSQREGLMLDSSEELYKWFTQQVGWYRREVACTQALYFVPLSRENARGRGFPRLVLASRESSRYPPNSGLLSRLSRRPCVGLATRRAGSESRPDSLSPWSNSRFEQLTPWSCPSPTPCASGPSPTLASWSESRPDPWSLVGLSFSIPVFNASAILVNNLLICVPPVEEDG